MPDNIEHFLTHVRRQCPMFEDKLDNLALLKTYLRRADNCALVRDHIQQRFGSNTYPLFYLQADICRKVLLIETEGWSTFDSAG